MEAGGSFTRTKGTISIETNRAPILAGVCTCRFEALKKLLLLSDLLDFERSPDVYEYQEAYKGRYVRDHVKHEYLPPGKGREDMHPCEWPKNEAASETYQSDENVLIRNLEH